MHFTKLFSTITDSSVWAEDHATRIVWVTMLAMADIRGEVHAAVPGLARRAVVTLEEAEAALAKLLSPDPYSRSPEHDGRRLEPIPGGWRLLNHAKYKSLLSDEASRARKRDWWRRHKGLDAKTSSEHVESSRTRALDTSLDENSTHSTQVEVDVEAEVEEEVDVEGVRGRPKRKAAAKPRAPKPKAERFVPESWQPNDAHREKASELRILIDRELQSFRCHEFRTPKSDWDRAFHAWLTRSAQFGTSSGGGVGKGRYAGGFSERQTSVGAIDYDLYK